MPRQETYDLELTWLGKEREAPARALRPGDLELVERCEQERLSPQVELALGAAPAERDLLIRGDNLLAMELLRERFAGAIDLVYCDPPFATGLSYYSQAEVSGAAVERRAYRDNLQGGIAGYADAMYRRLRLVRELLAAEGKLFLHCDWRASALLRLVLDELFGPECFRNEIIWRRAPNLGRQAASRQLGRVFDSILVYSKTEGAAFPGPVPRRRAPVALDGKGKPKGARWDEEAKAYFTTAPRGDYTDDSIAELRKKNRVYESSTGTVYIKYFLTQGDDGRWYKEQPADAIWDDFAVRPLRHRPKAEDMGYDTQKPEGLLERIIGWASRPGDRVADFFCGSGTTAAVAARMGRRFIACDRERTAVEITRRRLAAVRASFDVYSVERAERRLFGDVPAAVLAESGAEPVEGRWGRRSEADLCVVGPLEAPMRAADILAAAARARERGAASLTVLAWEWEAHDVRELRERALAEHGVALTMRTIPMGLARAMPKQEFHLRPEVDVDLVRAPDARGWAVRLLDVRCPDSPRLREGARLPVELGTYYVDGWRLDYGSAGDAFSPLWQATRQGDRIELMTPFFLSDSRGVARVRVFTVFGEELARTLQVEC